MVDNVPPNTIHRIGDHQTRFTESVTTSQLKADGRCSITTVSTDRSGDTNRPGPQTTFFVRAVLCEKEKPNCVTVSARENQNELRGMEATESEREKY